MNSNAIAAKRKADSSFLKKGVVIAILSGVTYGLYTGFMTLGMARGVWVDLYDPASSFGLSDFALIYVLGSLGSAVNDTCSGIWTLLNAAVKGMLGDFFRVLKTKPGWVMIILAIIGGPIASTCYVVALQMGGSFIVPIASLNASVGALVGHFVFKQELNGRMVLGILICLGCASVIGGTSFAGLGPEAMMACGIAFICAVGWGVEGSVAGFGTTLIDYQIGITIRQCTSGLSNMLIMLPILCMLDSAHSAGAFNLLGSCFTDSSLIFFIISGAFSAISYSFWYKGASMCGAALGMTCNGAYSFWCPFFVWIICGIFGGQEGWELSPVQWIAAVVMILGIALVGNLNPLDIFKKKEAK